MPIVPSAASDTRSRSASFVQALFSQNRASSEQTRVMISSGSLYQDQYVHRETLAESSVDGAEFKGIF